MKTASRTFHDFWFEAAPPARLALLRILVGAFAVWYIVGEQDDLAKVARTDPRLFAPVGVVFGAPLGQELFQWLYRATACASICFMLGLWHRVTGPLFALLQLWLLCYRNSWSMIYHSDNLLVLHTVVLGFARCADVLSMDALLRNLSKPDRAAPVPSWQYGWPIKLMIGLTVSTYFITSIAKLAGPLGFSWITGRALRSQMAVDQLRKELLGVEPNPLSYALYDWLPLFTLLAAGSFCLEFFAPLALFNKRLGRVWAINTFLMHWGILAVMKITFRYQLSGVLFAPFFPLERVLEVPRDLWLRWRRRTPPESMPRSVHSAGATAHQSLPRSTLYYDGTCGLCDRFVQFVLRHDRRECFQFATLQSELGREQLSRLGPEDDLRTVVLVEDGQSYVRSTATLRVCRRLGGLWPLLYGFIVVPTLLRDAVYALVARNRKRLFRGRSACAVMQPEWRRRFLA